jgi:hypothetical protein
MNCHLVSKITELEHSLEYNKITLGESLLAKIIDILNEYKIKAKKLYDDVNYIHTTISLLNMLDNDDLERFEIIEQKFYDKFNPK